MIKQDKLQSSERIFSSRAPRPLPDNPLTRARRAAGPLLDLTLSSPSAAGLAPDPEHSAEALRRAAAAPYRPDARGLLSAREAVCGYYARRGLQISPDRILLTSSTAEGYAALFSLLADPGQAVLLPTPSYPLLYDLLALQPLSCAGYASSPTARGWRIDASSLYVAAEAPLAAAIWVNPNNPSGARLHPEDRALLTERLARRGLPLIADEVFLDYLRPGLDFAAESFASESGPLRFCLSGLSKVCGLAGLKLSWILVSGEASIAREAAARLELILDSFLSVNAIAQAAAPALLAAAEPWQARVRARLAENLSAAHELLRSWRPLPWDGGWSLMIEHEAPGDDEATAIAAAERGLAVHPAYLFAPDGEELTPGRCRLVLSLLTEPSSWREGLSRLEALKPSRREANAGKAACSFPQSGSHQT